MSVAAFSQIRPATEFPEREDFLRGADTLLKQAQRVDLKVEQDTSGRVSRVVIEGAATDFVYDANGKVDGFTTAGRSTKIRMAADPNGNPVIRFFDNNGIELTPIELKSIGFPQLIIDTVVANSHLAEAGVIEPKAFSAFEARRAAERFAVSSSNAPTQKLRGEKQGAAFVGDGDTPRFTPQCLAKCDYELSGDLSKCDRADSDSTFVCGGLGLLMIENPIGAGAVVLVCLDRARGRLAECREFANWKRFSCVSNCNN